MSLSDYVPARFIALFSDPGFAKAIKGYTKHLLHEDQEFRKEIIVSIKEELGNSFVDNAIATSELRILKRLAAVEQILGLEDYGLEENSAPTLPQRIEQIEEKVNGSITNFKPPVEPKIQPTTKTEKRAVSLIDHLKETGKDHLTSPEIFTFLKCKLPDNCKINENIQNIRKVKQDVLKKAAAMYPNVFLSKKNTGHREVRLVLAS
ncbi:MAG TPA: hypothetical protein VGK06_10165 [Methanosarcina sp.]|jgi:hypothetical protein